MTQARLFTREPGGLSMWGVGHAGQLGSVAYASGPHHMRESRPVKSGPPGRLDAPTPSRRRNIAAVRPCLLSPGNHGAAMMRASGDAVARNASRG